MTDPITTSSGTTVHLERRGGLDLVILDNPNAPDDMRHHEAGQVIDGGFQPVPFAFFALSPDALRAVAQLIERAL